MAEPEPSKESFAVGGRYEEMEFTRVEASTGRLVTEKREVLVPSYTAWAQGE